MLQILKGLLIYNNIYMDSESIICFDIENDSSTCTSMLVERCFLSFQTREYG